MDMIGVAVCRNLLVLLCPKAEDSQVFRLPSHSQCNCRIRWECTHEEICLSCRKSVEQSFLRHHRHKQRIWCFALSQVVEKRGIRHYPTTAVRKILDSKAVPQFSPDYLFFITLLRGTLLPQSSVTTVVREIRTFVRLCRLNSCSQKNSPKGLVRSFDFFIFYPKKTGRSFLVRCVPHGPLCDL